MKLNIYNKTGKKTDKKIDLTDNLVTSFNEDVVNQYVFSYLSNQRQANAHTKTRSEVSGGGKKPWRQKGTGRARAGSTRSPIFAGGGVTFGPRNVRNFKKKVNKKVKRIALSSLISRKIEAENFFIVADLKLKQTKDVLNFYVEMKFEKKLLIITAESDQELYKAANNIKNITVKPLNELNAFMVANHNSMVLTKEAVEKANEVWGV